MNFRRSIVGPEHLPRLEVLQGEAENQLNDDLAEMLALWQEKLRALKKHNEEKKTFWKRINLTDLWDLVEVGTSYELPATYRADLETIFTLSDLVDVALFCLPAIAGMPKLWLNLLDH